jgi:hypothetical protein
MWNERKKRKTLVTIVLLLVLAVVGLRGLHIQSVPQYQEEQETLTLDLGLASPLPTGQKVAAGGGQQEEKQASAPKKESKEKNSKENISASAVPTQTVEKEGRTSQGDKSSQKKKQQKKKQQKNKKKKDKKTDGSDKKVTVGSESEPVTSPTVSSAAPGQAEPDSSNAGGQSDVSIAEKTPEPTKTEDKEKITCYLEIRCDKLVENKSKADKSIWDYIPDDGTLLSKTKVSVEKGTTAYELLSMVCQSQNIALDAEYTPMYQSYYVSGIGHLYEKQAGSMSGWIYKVNGKAPNKGASSFTMSEGDECVWNYTCDGKTS